MALVVYDGSGGGGGQPSMETSWRACCNRVLFATSPADITFGGDDSSWAKSLERLLDLSCTELPFGRSWEERLRRMADDASREECAEAFSSAILHSAALLARELFACTRRGGGGGAEATLTKDVDNLVRGAMLVLDSNKPLYHSRASPFPSSSSNTALQDEGFEQLHSRAMATFLSETENLSALVGLVPLAQRNGGDLALVARLAKLMLQICGEYDPKHRPSFLPVQAFITTCCDDAITSCTTSNGSNIRLVQDLVKDLVRLDVERGYARPVAAWKRMALAWFRSEKLTMKRQGLEQLGQLAKFLRYDAKLTKAQVSAQFDADGGGGGLVLQDLFQVDDRLLPGLEEILPHVEMEPSMLTALLRRGGSLSVQRLLGNLCMHYSFDEETCVQILNGATRQMVEDGTAATTALAGSALLRAALVDSKQTRTTLLRKGKQCAAAVVSALLVLVVASASAVSAAAQSREEETHVTTTALVQCLQEFDGKPFKRVALDYLVCSAFDLEHAQESFLPASRGGNRLAALRALLRVLSLYPSRASASTAVYGTVTSENVLRADILAALQRDFLLGDLLLLDDDDATTPGVFQAKLDLLAFYKRFSGTHTGLQVDELNRLYALAVTGEEDGLESFAYWLTLCSARGSNPILDQDTARFVLTGLFSKQDLTERAGEALYKLMQVLFLSVNALDCKEEQDVGSQQFKRSQPAPELRGAKLIGRNVSVLHLDKSMQEAVITGYTEMGRHVFEYYTGVVEEKSMEELDEWWLLPPAPAAAGAVVFAPKTQEQVVQSKLAGVDKLWEMALECAMDSVALRASNLLFGLYACNHRTDLFVQAVFDRMADLQHERDMVRCLDLVENLDVLLVRTSNSSGGGEGRYALVLFALLTNPTYSLQFKLRVWDLLRGLPRAMHAQQQQPPPSYWQRLFELDVARNDLTEALDVLLSDSALAPHLVYSLDLVHFPRGEVAAREDAGRLVSLLLRLAELIKSVDRADKLAWTRLEKPSLDILTILESDRATAAAAVPVLDVDLIWHVLVVHVSEPVRQQFAKLLARREHYNVKMLRVLLDCFHRLQNSPSDVPQSADFFQLLLLHLSSSDETALLLLLEQQQLCFPQLFDFVTNTPRLVRGEQPTILLGCLRLLPALARLAPLQDVPIVAQRLLQVFFLQANTWTRLDLPTKRALSEMLAQASHMVVREQFDALLAAFPNEFIPDAAPARQDNQGKVGLVNQGSTCYLNSVLQLLFSVEPFRWQILSAKLSDPLPPSIATQTMLEPSPSPPIVIGWRCWCSGVNDCDAASCEICGTMRSPEFELLHYDDAGSFPGGGGEVGDLRGMAASPAQSNSAVEVLRQVQRVFTYLQCSASASFDPMPLVLASKSLNLLYPVTSQNDAGEFYDKVLDAIERGFKEEGLPYDNCFSGQSCILRKCLHCHATSKSQLDVFTRLELMARSESELKHSLDECLEAYCLPELLCGDNKVDCDACKLRSDTSFTHCLSQLPRFLFIQPKRFTYDLEANRTVKLNHFIQFEREIDLSRVTETFICSAESREEVLYQLDGVLIHKGRAGGGHYYAFVRDDGEEGGKWVCCNDERVSAFDIDHELAQECFGGTQERSTTDEWGYVRTQIVDVEKSAFMLLYSRRVPAVTAAAAVNSRKRKFQENDVAAGREITLKAEVDAANLRSFHQALLADSVSIQLYFDCLPPPLDGGGDDDDYSDVLDFYFKVVCHHCDLKQCGEWLDRVCLPPAAATAGLQRFAQRSAKLFATVLYDFHLPRHKRLATLFGIQLVLRAHPGLAPDFAQPLYDEYSKLAHDATSPARQRNLLESYWLICAHLKEFAPPPEAGAVAGDCLDLFTEAASPDFVVHDYLTAFAPQLENNVKLQVFLLDRADSALVVDYIKQALAQADAALVDEFVDKLLLAVLMDCSKDGGGSGSGLEAAERTLTWHKIDLLKQLVRDNGNGSSSALEDKVVDAVRQAVFSPTMEDAMRLGPANTPLPYLNTVWEELLLPSDVSLVRFAFRILHAFVCTAAASAVPVSSKWKESGLLTWFLLVTSPLNQLAHTWGFDCEFVRDMRRHIQSFRAEAADEDLEAKFCGLRVEDVYFSVERAGDATVNGKYMLKPPLVANNARWYCEENALSLYKCQLDAGGEEWFISRLLPGVSHSDSRTVDYYSCAITTHARNSSTLANSNSNNAQMCHCLVPNALEWVSRATASSNGVGSNPAPIVRKVCAKSVVVREETSFIV